MNEVAAATGGRLAWWIWALGVAFVVYTFSFQTGYSVVNGAVQADVGLSVSQVATIAAVYTWAFAPCQLLGGALLDRYGSRAVLPISVALVTVSVFVFANAGSYRMLLVSQVIFAVGSCTAFVGAGYLGGQWFGMARYGFMFGLVAVCSALSSAFAVNLFEAVLGVTDWRTLFNVYGAAGVVILGLSAVYVRNPAPIPGAGEGVGGMIRSVTGDLVQVGRIGHVWVASVIGAAQFGSLLALGVVWMPKLLQVHGLSPSAAGFTASLLWLGYAAGNATFPTLSTRIERRKPPIVVACAVTLGCMLALLYVPVVGQALASVLCFTFGFGAASTMLAFSTAADVVKPSHIGTSAAFVNGVGFLLGGVLIGRPGMRIGLGIEAGIEPQSQAIAQYAGRPLLIALVIAVVLALVLKETYPKARAA